MTITDKTSTQNGLTCVLTKLTKNGSTVKYTFNSKTWSLHAVICALMKKFSYDRSQYFMSMTIAKH